MWFTSSANQAAQRHPCLNSDDNALPDNVESRIMPPYSVVSDVDRWKLTSPDIIIDVRGTTRWVGEMLHK